MKVLKDCVIIEENATPIKGSATQNFFSQITAKIGEWTELSYTADVVLDKTADGRSFAILIAHQITDPT